MTDYWEPEVVRSVGDLESTVLPLEAAGWLFRGQSRVHGELVPSIDRGVLGGLGRAVKLILERRSIEAFRQNLSVVSNESERLALTDPHIALMVMRHFDVPTRLMDWSESPHVAAWFASERNPESDAEIWAFDRLVYQVEGFKQWAVGPPVTKNGEFHPQLTMFLPQLGSIDWFVCAVYLRPTFPRQNAQKGWFSLTAHFEVDHADYLARLLRTPSCCRRFIIPRALKSEILPHLSLNHGLERSVLFPGQPSEAVVMAAEAARAVFPPS